MSQTLSNVLIHFVYSTKHRQTWLKDQQVRDEMYAIMGKILQDFDCHPILINGVEDHVHVLCDFTRNYTIKKVVGELKTGPSKWIKSQGASYRDFQWQSGYGAFSVSQSMKASTGRLHSESKKAPPKVDVSRRASLALPVARGRD